MARPISFEQKEVLDKVVALFWERGFEATSIQDLVEATGLNRSSLYNSFGSKEGLFAAALEHYIATFSRDRLAALAQTNNAKEGLRRYFDDLIRFSVGEGKGLGCLLTNSATELASKDAAVARQLNEQFEVVRQLFADLIVRAQAQGEVAHTKDSEAIASFLLTTIQGIRVLSRAYVEEEQLRQTVKTALSVLE